MRISLNKDLEISRLVLGMWRLLDWNKTDQKLLSFLKESMELGVTTFDHADIYGNHECEGAFGKALKLEPSLRDQMEIVTKCGIKLQTDKFPDRKVKYYDYSSSYIIQQAEESLKNLETDHIDVLLLHRPSPFFNPEEVAAAFDQLLSSGKVRHFGVSNFLPEQLQSLQNYLDIPLVTNQIEISPYCLEHFENQNIDYLIGKKIAPMAWSPLAGGELFNPKTDNGKRVHAVLQNITNDLDNISLDQVILQWLLMHPSRIIPVQSAVKAMQVKLTLEQWFEIYIAAAGQELP